MNPWDSRWMLPEHRRMCEEESVRRQAEETGALRPPSRRELEWVRTHAALSVLSAMAERGRHDIARSSMPLKRFFAAVAARLEQAIAHDLQQLHRALDGAGIRILNETRSPDGVVCRFVCRGFEERLTVTREALRAEIQIKLEAYLSSLGR